jgi:hypothetical protein
MPTITLHFTNEQVQELQGAVAAEALMMARNPDIAPLLPEGTTLEDVEGWSIKRKAKLVIYAKLIMVRQNHERLEAARIAGDAAADNARDTSAFELEDDDV